MSRKVISVAALLALSAGTALPAAAGSSVNPYGNLTGARTTLQQKDDERPKDALQTAASTVEEPSSRISISPFWAQSKPAGGVDVQQYGADLAYADVSGKNPWQLNLGLFNTNLDGAGIDQDDFGFNAGFKYQLWAPAGINQPVVSLAFNYLDIDSIGNRFDVLLAADQRLTKDIYATVNLGYADADPDGGGGADDFVVGVGATWVGQKWSLSVDYTLDNDVNGRDFWSAAVLYNLNANATLRVGGGTDNTYMFNVIWNIDRAK